MDIEELKKNLADKNYCKNINTAYKKHLKSYLRDLRAL